MALIVEDGSRVANSNTYISLADAETYMADRIDANWTSAATPEKNAALIEAGMYLNSLNWKGSKVVRDQSMELPRQDFTDGDGFEFTTTMIPAEVPDAQVEGAREHIAGSILLPTVKPDNMIKRKKIDVLEKEFFAGASSGQTSFSKIDSLLSGLLTGGRNMGVITRS